MRHVAHRCTTAMIVAAAVSMLACSHTAPMPTAPSAVAFEPPAHGVWRQVVLRTSPDPVPCDGQERNFRWAPTSVIEVRRITLWIGTTYQAPQQIDVRTTLLLPDGFVLAYLGLDHYAPFTGPHQIERGFDPPLVVQSTEALVLQHMCTLYGPGTAQSATNAIVDYSVMR